MGIKIDVFDLFFNTPDVGVRNEKKIIFFCVNNGAWGGSKRINWP